MPRKKLILIYFFALLISLPLIFANTDTKLMYAFIILPLFILAYDTLLAFDLFLIKINKSESQFFKIIILIFSLLLWILILLGFWYLYSYLEVTKSHGDRAVITTIMVAHVAILFLTGLFSFMYSLYLLKNEPKNYDKQILFKFIFSILKVSILPMVVFFIFGYFLGMGT